MISMETETHDEPLVLSHVENAFASKFLEVGSSPMAT